LTDLKPLFSPRAVAVVGASRSPGSIGFHVVRNLLDFGFSGPVYPVNPKAAVILQQPCYPSVESLPDGIDMAVLILPADKVASTIRVCHRRGIRAVITVSAGFREADGQGAALEREVRETLDELGMRMVGPNCMGLISTAGNVRLNASFAFTQPLVGNVAFASQSGSLGEAILSHASIIGLGLSDFVSLGNAADVTAVDLLRHWARDPRTQVILLYLESMPDAQAFMDAALAATREARKPVLAVKSGRTRAGARAASSHTGSMAGHDRLTNALFKRSGIIRLAEIDDLFTVAKAFSSQPLPQGARVGILTNAGGPGIQATDATIHYGLQVAKLEPETIDALSRVLPKTASLTNPVDMVATADGPTFERCAEILLADPGVDALVLIYVTPIIFNTIEVSRCIVEGLHRGLKVAGRPKPVVACVMGKAHGDPGHAFIRDAGFPVYPFPEKAIKGLAAMHKYARWLKQPEESPPVLTVRSQEAGQRIAELPGGWLETDTANRLLEDYGIPVRASRQVDTPVEALRFTEELHATDPGRPVVLKVESTEILHKTDVGGVELDLRTPDEIRAAFRKIEAAIGPDAPPHTFRIQAMAQGGIETIIGVIHAPTIGPTAMFGLGGIAVEVTRDVRFEMLPITPTVARRMIRGIRGVRLLEGIRGRQTVDMDQLEDVIVRVGQLVSDHPRIHELDINPFLANADAEQAGVADVRIRLADAP